MISMQRPPRLRAVQSITLDIESGGPKHTFKTFAEADHQLLQWASAAPPSGEGYDKCWFTVVWEHDITYSGRIDLNRPDTDTPHPSLAQAIVNVLGVFACGRPPAHLTEVQAQTIYKAYQKSQPALVDVAFKVFDSCLIGDTPTLAQCQMQMEVNYMVGAGGLTKSHDRQLWTFQGANPEFIKKQIHRREFGHLHPDQVLITATTPMWEWQPVEVRQKDLVATAFAHQLDGEIVLEFVHCHVLVRVFRTVNVTTGKDVLALNFHYAKDDKGPRYGLGNAYLWRTLKPEWREELRTALQLNGYTCECMEEDVARVRLRSGSSQGEEVWASVLTHNPNARG